MLNVKECEHTLEMCTDETSAIPCTGEAHPRPPQIAIRGLTKIYPMADGDVVALDSIDLSIDKGDIYGIIGMSGAGKSTLIRCLNRLDTPTAGQVLVDGQDVLTMPATQLRAMRRRMAMISSASAAGSRSAVSTALRMRSKCARRRALPKQQRARVMAWCSHTQAVLLPRCCW